DKIAEKHILKISGQFTIKNSLIIGSTFIDDKVDKNKSPDKTHLKDSKGIPLLTGKSIKGAIRHRALKILNTIGKSNTLNIIDDLFGNVNEESKKIERSRIKSFESKIKNAEQDQLQPRIKIDRFTQGTIDSALMKSQPLWHKAEIVEITLEIENCRQEEAGLLLLVMSDLMNEDLPIGGEKAIGRGVLTGIALNLNGSILKDGKPSEGQNAETIPVELSFNKAVITDRDKTETVNSWIHKLNENY
ncbi:MAG: RAMP superfamily CRISPR-associated protein, partial [Saprospiraceae bacterium]